ncbi:MAG: WD40 repeat domain-containing protein, partial [Gemmataceae bacterium]|nr:WD40 repeat domain-containing protein [Gemmataceae bacterium]
GGPPPGVVGVLGSARFRTPSGSWYPVFSPDGRRIASAGWDAVHVLDARTGRLAWRAPLPADRGDGDSLALPGFAPDGGVVVLYTVRGAGRVDRYDPSGRPVERAALPALDAPHVWALSGDGSRVVAASALDPAKAVIRVYDARTGKPLGTHHPAGVKGPFGAVVLSPDGRRVALEDNDTVRVFDTDTGAAVDAWDVPGQIAMNLTFTPDGRRLVVNRHNEGPRVRVRDLTAKRTTDLPSGYSPWLTVSRDGRSLVGQGENGGIAVWDLDAGRLVRRFGGKWYTRVGALSPDGRTLVTAGDYGAFTLWDAATGDRLPESADPPEGVNELRFVGDRSVAARLGTGSFTFGWAVWDIGTGRPAPRPAGSDAWGQGDLSPDGRLVAHAGPLRVVERESGLGVWQAADKDRGTSPHMARFTSDGRRLILRYGQEVEVRDAETGGVEKTVKAPNGGRLIGLSPDGRYLLADEHVPFTGKMGSPGERLRAVDLVSGETLPDFEPELIHSWTRAAFTPDGRRVAYCTCRWVSQERENGGTHTPVHALLVVREVGTWRVIGQHDCSTAGVWAGQPAISPDGRFVVHSDAHGATLREVETGRVVRELAHREPVSALAFAPDGKTLATAATGTPVYLWDLTGKRPDNPAEFAEPPPTAAAVKMAVASLTTADPESATEALRVLHAAGDEAVAAIRAGVKPAVAPDPAQVKRWIADLGSDDFAARDRAEKELTRRATTVAPAVRAANAANPTLEQGRRLDRILVAAEKPTPDDIAGVRAVGVLARVGTPEALAVLREFAAGAAGAEPTRAAAEALRWLGR